MLLFVTLALVGVVYAWAVASFPAVARRRAWLAGVLGVVWLSQPIAFWMVRHPLPFVLPRLIVDMALEPLLIAAFPLAVLRLGCWAYDRWGARRRAPLPAMPEVAVRPVADGCSRRQVVEGVGGAAVFGATGAMLGWGIVRGRHAFELEEVALRVPGLPRALDGYVIAQVSDVHVGTHVGERELDEGLALVRRARPDLIVATGDLVDFDARYAPLLARKLTDLAPRDGVAAVLGNHDYYAICADVVAALRGGGVRLLIDEGCVLRADDGGGFALLGVDDRWSTRYGRAGPRLERAANMVPPELPRILLSHQPITVERWAGEVAVQLSGHTHGGQINPGFRPAELVLKYLAGRYEVDGTTLYVNRGFGTVGTPSRVGAPPEVTRIVLVAA